VHASTEAKSDDTKHSFYGELERGLEQFPKYNMKILLGDFSSISKYNVVRVVNFVTTRIYLQKVQCFHIATFINTFGFLIGRPSVRFNISG